MSSESMRPSAESKTLRTINSHDTRSLREVVEIGKDLLLLPVPDPVPYEEVRALKVAGVIDPEDSTLFNAVTYLDQIQSQYDQYLFERKSEPRWFSNLPVSVRTHIRYVHAVTEEDPLAILNIFPYTNISYMIRNGGLCEEVCRTFNLWRLEGIKQLGFLQAPTYQAIFQRQALSDSNRYVHSLDVMAVASLLGHNAGLGDHDLNLLRTAALTHDVGTPAGGDSVKLVDPEGLDEDKNYPEIIDKLDLRTLYEQYGVDPGELKELVRTQAGTLGQLLDIADKIAYVARDLSKCLHHVEAGARHADQPGLQTLLNIVKRYPDVCSLWDSVKIQGDQVYFSDASRLIAFLKVRLILFRELYYHPESRSGEFLLSRLLVKILYAKGKLTKDMLLSLDDAGLLRVMDQEYGTGNSLDTVSSEFARAKTFSKLEDAQRFMQELKDWGNVFAMLDDNRRGIKTGTNFLVTTPDGLKPLSIADTGAAQELQEMATMLPMVHVYYLDGDPAIPREKLDQLKEELKSLGT